MQGERVWAASPTEGWLTGQVVLDGSLPAGSVRVKADSGEVLPVPLPLIMTILI